MTLGGVHHSRNSDDWSTPPEFYAELNKEFAFDFDPCPIAHTFDGLSIPWFGSIFCNPPYSGVKAWMKKAHEELDAGRAHTIVFLVFARTDTAWFHDYVLARGGEVRFVRGRLRFSGINKKGKWVNDAAPTPSIVVVFKKKLLNTPSFSG